MPGSLLAGIPSAVQAAAAASAPPAASIIISLNERNLKSPKPSKLVGPLILLASCVNKQGALQSASQTFLTACGPAQTSRMLADLLFSVLRLIGMQRLFEDDALSLPIWAGRMSHLGHA